MVDHIEEFDPFDSLQFDRTVIEHSCFDPTITEGLLP
jgi:hypothetical protein